MFRLFFFLSSLPATSLRNIRTDRGAAGVEYGILVAAIAALIVALAFTIGGEIQTAFQTVCDSLVGAGNTC